MGDRFNTIAGWILFSGVMALGLASFSSHYFEADKARRPATMGYAIAGVVSASGPAAAVVPIEVLLGHADATKGAEVFKKCASCHTVNQGGGNGIGPNLYAVLGDTFGQGRGGFAFSDGLKAKAEKITFATLNTWLTDPRGMVSGTKMTFAGLEDPQERADVIAYLNTQGSNLPLPKAPAVASGSGANAASGAAPAAAPAPAAKTG